MRELTEVEKKANQKAINRYGKEIKIHELSVDVLEGELALLDKKTEIAKFNKEQDLNKAKSNVSYIQSQIDILNKQNTEGVEEKNAE